MAKQKRTETTDLPPSFDGGVEAPEPEKEPLLQSERFRLTALGVVANVVVVLAPKYLDVELSTEEVAVLVLGVSGLIANYIQARTKRNTSV